MNAEIKIDQNFNPVVNVEMTGAKLRGSLANDWVEIEIEGKTASLPIRNLIHALLSIHPHVMCHHRHNQP